MTRPTPLAMLVAETNFSLDSLRADFLLAVGFWQTEVAKLHLPECLPVLPVCGAVTALNIKLYVPLISLLMLHLLHIPNIRLNAQPSTAMPRAHLTHQLDLTIPGDVYG